MAGAFVQDLLSAGASNKAAGTTLAATFTASAAAGNLIVGCFVFDNAAVASKPVVSSISKPAGETANWVFLGAARSTSTTAGSFASGELWCIKTTVAWTTPTITVTLDTSTVMKAANYYEFSGTTATARSTGATAYSTTTTAASAVTTGTAPVVGDLVLGLTFQSNAAAITTLDVDTVGGAWVSRSNGVGSTGGNATTNNFGLLQYKVTTATTQQTLNAGGTPTAGNGAIVAVLQATPPAAPVARTISAAAGTPAQTAVNLTWAADIVASPAPTYLIESSPNGSTGWTTVASGQTGQTGYNATGLLPGTTYYFRVTGSNASGSTTSNVAGPVTTTSYPKVATFTEPFNTLTTFNGVAGAPSISTGRLQLDCTVPNGEMVQSVGIYDLTNSSAFVKLTPPPAPTGSAERQSQLELNSTGPTTENIRLILSRTSSVSQIYGHLDFVTIFGQTAFNPATMVYLRIALAGTTLTLSYSADGNSWTAFATQTVTATWAANMAAAEIFLTQIQATADATDPQACFFDDFNIAAPVAGGRPKVYLAGAFTKKPLKVWTGAAWVEKPIKVWTGSAWKTLT